jgi:hypothetical protein
LILVAALLLTAPAQASVAGLYQAQQMEVGAALELQADGRFRYQLDYGAVSEQAEGDWTFDGATVRLTTKPMPKLPSFELVRDDPAPQGELRMTVEPPGFGAAYRLDAIATDADSGEKGLVTTDTDGRVDSGGRRIASVDPMVPVYGTVAGHFPLSPDRGHHLLLRFHRNDLGRAAFDREPLEATSRGLLLTRYDAQIRFVRVGP